MSWDALLLVGAMAKALAPYAALALTALVIAVWAATCLARGWLHWRRVRASLRRNEDEARRFWAQLEARGMAAVPDSFPWTDEDRWLLRFGDLDEGAYGYEDAGDTA